MITRTISQVFFNSRHFKGALLWVLLILILGGGATVIGADAQDGPTMSPTSGPPGTTITVTNVSEFNSCWWVNAEFAADGREGIVKFSQDSSGDLKFTVPATATAGSTRWIYCSDFPVTAAETYGVISQGQAPLLGTFQVVAQPTGGGSSAQESVEVVWRVPSTWSEDLITTIADEVGDEFGITIVVDFNSTPLLDQLAVDSAAGESSFDLTIVDAEFALHYYDTGLLLPDMDSYSETVDPFEAAAIGFREPGGTLMAIPVITTPIALIYNTDIMEELGIEMSNRLSWASLIDITDQLNNEGLRVAFGMQPAVGAIIIDQFGGNEIHFSPELSDWLMIADMAADIEDLFHRDNVYTDDSSVMLDNFQGGDTAIVVTWYSFNLSLIDNGFESHAVMLFPGITDTPSGGGHGFGIAVSSLSEDPEFNQEIAAALAAHPLMANVSLEIGALPANNSGFNVLFEQPEFEQLPPATSVELLFDLAEESVLWQVPLTIDLDGYSNIIDVSVEFMINVLNNGASIVDETEAIVNAIEEAKLE